MGKAERLEPDCTPPPLFSFIEINLFFLKNNKKFGVESRSVDPPHWGRILTELLSTGTHSVHLFLLYQLRCIDKFLAIEEDDGRCSKTRASPKQHVS